MRFALQGGPWPQLRWPCAWKTLPPRPRAQIQELEGFLVLPPTKGQGQRRQGPAAALRPVNLACLASPQAPNRSRLASGKVFSPGPWRWRTQSVQRIMLPASGLAGGALGTRRSAWRSGCSGCSAFRLTAARSTSSRRLVVSAQFSGKFSRPRRGDSKPVQSEPTGTKGRPQHPPSSGPRPPRRHPYRITQHGSHHLDRKPRRRRQLHPPRPAGFHTASLTLRCSWPILVPTSRPV